MKLPAPPAPTKTETVAVADLPPREDTVVEPPPMAALPQPENPVYGFSMAELELYDINMNKVPAPPRCIQEHCQRADWVWRWMSPSAIKYFGMRGYVAYSPDKDVRQKIKDGDCPASIYVDVENKVRWREDSFLAVTPRRLYEARQAAKRQRTDNQTRVAREAAPGLRELSNRAGVSVEYHVDEWKQQGE